MPTRRPSRRRPSASCSSTSAGRHARPVEPFLINLFSDRDIIELPLGALLQPVVARIIAKSRGPSVRRTTRDRRRLAAARGSRARRRRALEARLNAAGTARRARSSRCATGSRRPSRRPRGHGRRRRLARIVTLTLFPHYSQATTGSSEKELARALAQPVWRGRFTVTRHPFVPGRSAVSRRDGRHRAPRARRGSRRTCAIASCCSSARTACRRSSSTAATRTSRRSQRTRRGILERLNAAEPPSARLPVAHRPGEMDRPRHRGEAARSWAARASGTSWSCRCRSSRITSRPLYEVDMLFADAAKARHHRLPPPRGAEHASAVHRVARQTGRTPPRDAAR